MPPSDVDHSSLLSRPQLGGNPHNCRSTNHIQSIKNVPISFCPTIKIELEELQMARSKAGPLLLTMKKKESRLIWFSLNTLDTLTQGKGSARTKQAPTR
jgi:hypothetical protein